MSCCGGIFDYETKYERLQEVKLELEDSAVWHNPTQAQELGRERAKLEEIVNNINNLAQGIADVQELVKIAVDEQDLSALTELNLEANKLATGVAQLEFQRMFSHELDSCNAFVDIQSGSGGTEAQDWAEMLLRMYLRWSEQHNFSVAITEISAGDVAGIKGATIHVIGKYAHGWLRTETGVHRLVRKSPFDSGNRRHTSFAAVFVYPDIDETIEVAINPQDLKIDTYRASGAGGQHVNRTDSAVRITHIPTNIVVQCQSNRSQHQNKAYALKQLKAKLHEREVHKMNEHKQQLEDNKSDIGWGSQIRSYVLDQSRIKDLRTNVETTNIKAVLDGDLDMFMEASLKSNF